MVTLSVTINVDWVLKNKIKKYLFPSPFDFIAYVFTNFPLDQYFPLTFFRSWGNPKCLSFFLLNRNMNM